MTDNTVKLQTAIMRNARGTWDQMLSNCKGNNVVRHIATPSPRTDWYP